ncbi:uncharacterized protein LOC133842794 [Drosophila sulfurigaster albostrigata]|uniref:uncharacterized protein LOC133842794 n=1 Tax=Drosophila sulfurigaster albostrigata TaxID=89887 RepID=UPI002D21C134|nr:uncharacterized protein LOC133842794 [Drosophila sulfurigaster albostrigata]
MAQKRKQNSSRPSAMISKTTSSQSKPVKSAEDISRSTSDQSHKKHGIRSFFKILPFLPRFKRKTKTNQRKVSQISRIKIRSSSSLTNHDKRKLIRLYQSQENLYNPNHPDYGDSNCEDSSYAKISSFFPSKTCQEIQSYIHELRLLFEREYIVIENGYRRFGELLKPSIKYYNEFLFLVPFLRFSWDSAAYLPPKETCTDDFISYNSCTSDGTDRIMSSGDDLIGEHLNRSSAGKCFFFGKKKQTKKNAKSEDDLVPKEKPPAVLDAKQTLPEKPDPETASSPQKRLSRHSEEMAKNGKTVEEHHDTPRKSITEHHDAPRKSITDHHDAPRKSITDHHDAPRKSITDHHDAPRKSITDHHDAPRKSLTEEQHAAQKSKSDHKDASHKQFSFGKKTPAQQKGSTELSEQGSLEARRDSSNKRLSWKSDLSSGKSQEPLDTRKSVQSTRSSQASTSVHRGSVDRAPYQVNSYYSDSQSAKTSLLQQQQRRPSQQSQPTYPGNQEQLNMLCEMIKIELSASPDFIYYDAKWRIIEILREVQKRNMIHSKTDPTACKSLESSSAGRRESQAQKQHCSCLATTNCLINREATPIQRIPCPANATRCPYCCKH